MARRAMHGAARLLVIGLLFAAIPCRADLDAQTLPDPAAEVLVRTKSGASYVGRYTFDEQNQILTVQLPNGESFSFPLAQVASVQATAQLPPEQPDRAAQFQTQVEVRSNRPGTVLERQNPLLPEEQSWQAVCPAPCGKSIDNRFRYRIGGTRISPSQPFEIDGRSVLLAVRAGNGRSHRSGLGLLIAGSVVSGVSLIAGSFVLSTVSAMRRSDLFPIVGSVVGVGAAGGLSMLIAGIPLYVTQRTRVDVRRSE